jgi:C2H2-type zinc-finger domain
MQKHKNILTGKIYQCDQCAYKTAAKKNLVNHMTIHKSIKLQPRFNCVYCPKFFPRLALKTFHERKEHTKVEDEVKKTFNCYCGKIFTTYCGLYIHRKNEHETGEFPCEICKEVFTSKVRCSDHFVEVHKPKVPCEICGKMISKIGKHMQQHKARVKCTVEGCDKELANRQSLNAHISAVHEIQEGLKCDTCGAEFNSVYRLKTHVFRQHQAKKKACKVPGCSHSSARYLAMHYRNHKGIDPKEKARLIAELKRNKNK